MLTTISAVVAMMIVVVMLTIMMRTVVMMVTMTAKCGDFTSANVGSDK